MSDLAALPVTTLQGEDTTFGELTRGRTMPPLRPHACGLVALAAGGAAVAITRR